MVNHPQSAKPLTAFTGPEVAACALSNGLPCAILRVAVALANFFTQIFQHDMPPSRYRREHSVSPSPTASVYGFFGNANIVRSFC